MEKCKDRAIRKHLYLKRMTLQDICDMKQTVGGGGFCAAAECEVFEIMRRQYSSGITARCAGHERSPYRRAVCTQYAIQPTVVGACAQRAAHCVAILLHAITCYYARICNNHQ